MKRIILILSLLINTVTFGQSTPGTQMRNIHGSIYTENGQPVTGVKISPYGSSYSATVNIKGNFNVTVPQDVPILLQLHQFGREPFYVKVLPTDKNANVIINKQTLDLSAKYLSEWQKDAAGNTDMVRKIYTPSQFTKLVVADRYASDMSERIDEPVGNADVPQPKKDNDGNLVYTAVEIQPVFKTGEKGWQDYLTANVKYSPNVKDNDLKGKIYVQFVVEKDGSLSNVAVVRGLCSECDAEVVRVIKASKKWKPGIHDGKAVRVQYTIPFNFNQ